MNKEEKTLKSIHVMGGLFIVLAIFDVVNAVLGFVSQKEKINEAIASSGISQNLANGAFIAIFVFVGIIALMKLYVGVQGVTCTETKKPNKAVMTVLMILLVMTVIGLISVISACIKGNANITSVLSSIVSLSVVYTIRRDIKSLN